MQAKLAAIKSYVSTNNIPVAALIKMSKLGVVIETLDAADLLHRQRHPVLDSA